MGSFAQTLLLQANNHLRIATAEKELDAEDLARAALMSKEPAPDSEDAVAATASTNALLRVKTQGHISVLKTRVESSCQEAADKWEWVITTIATDFKENLAESLNTARDNLKSLFDDAMKAGELVRSSLGQLEARLLKEDTKEQLVATREEADNNMKDFTSQKMTKFNRSSAKLKRLVTQLKRRSDKAAVAKTAVKPTLETPPPLFEVSKALLAQGMTVSSSSFEAKCGLRAALIAPSQGDPGDTIRGWPKGKASIKRLEQHLKSNMHGLDPINDNPTIKRVLKELGKSFDKMLFSKLCLPEDQDWTRKVYDPWFYGMNKGYTFMNLNQMCVMDARLLIRGSVIMIGLPLLRNPPMTIREVRHAASTMTVDDLRDCLKFVGGWALEHDNTKLAVIPTGYLVLTVCKEDAIGIRWGMSSDEADTARVVKSLQVLLEEFPEIGNSSTGYSQWKQWVSEQ